MRKNHYKSFWKYELLGCSMQCQNTVTKILIKNNFNTHTIIRNNYSCGIFLSNPIWNRTIISGVITLHEYTANLHTALSLKYLTKIVWYQIETVIASYKNPRSRNRNVNVCVPNTRGRQPFWTLGPHSKIKKKFPWPCWTEIQVF